MEDTWKGKIAAHFFPKCLEWGLLEMRSAVESLLSNPGQIIASSYAVVLGWGKGLVMCFSALSEIGLYFRFSLVHGAETTVLLECLLIAREEFARINTTSLLCQLVVRLNDYLLAHTLLSKETHS